mgnify:CR=1 FL=1|tara:strand:- start:274 stop:684 length:411 start_codon:yes stop_codon:yes gene_type:complete
MSAASNFLENELLDHVLRGSGGAYTAPTTLYLALFTSDGGLENNTSGSQTEISTSGSAYSRQTIAFNDASSGSASNSATVTFSAATANWGTVTHVAIMDQSTGGNVLFHGAVTTSKTIESGDTFQVSSGNLTISLA